jgi:hypothetical protein
MKTIAAEKIVLEGVKNVIVKQRSSLEVKGHKKNSQSENIFS